MVTCSSNSIEPIESCPSFFKVIRYPSALHLALPDAFVRNYLEKIPKNPTLKTATGGHLWKLKFIKIGEDYCFAHGWEKLANDVQLCIRDIIVFWLIDPFTFQVSFLDANGCGKDLPLNNTTNNSDNSVDGLDDDLCFKKLISRKTHKYYMSLPMIFVKAAGLKNKTSIKMKDHEGKEWTFGILVERYHRVKYSLSTPWCIFRRYHRLSEGDECFFKFDKKEGVLKLSKVVRNKRPTQHSVDSGRGVKIEDEWWSPIEKPCNGGVKVKVEYESGGEVEVANRKRRAFEKPVNGVKVKFEDGSGSVEGVKRKMERLSVDKPSGGAKGEVQPERERLHICKRVVYF